MNTLAALTICLVLALLLLGVGFTVYLVAPALSSRTQHYEMDESAKGYDPEADWRKVAE